MSVIYYTAEELGNVAAVLGGNRSSDYGKQRFSRITRELALVSRCNAKAHRKTYGEVDDVPEVEAEQIRSAAPLLGNPKWAWRTLKGLHYNSISNGGTDFLEDDPAAVMALLSLALAALPE